MRLDAWIQVGCTQPEMAEPRDVHIHMCTYVYTDIYSCVICLFVACVYTKTQIGVCIDIYIYIYIYTQEYMCTYMSQPSKP